MRIEICKDENEWVATTNMWLKNQLQQNPRATRVFVPAGETPRPLYKSWQSGAAPFGQQTQLVQLDEVLVAEKPFQKFFVDELPKFQTQIEYIQSAEYGADIALLGLGINGHVAFHEPGLPKTFYSGCLTLAPDTCERLKLPQASRAVTYGVHAFLKAKAVALLVRGASKQKILKRILAGDVDCPASWLKEHKNLLVIADHSCA